MKYYMAGENSAKLLAIAAGVVVVVALAAFFVMKPGGVKVVKCDIAKESQACKSKLESVAGRIKDCKPTKVEMYYNGEPYIFLEVHKTKDGKCFFNSTTFMLGRSVSYICNIPMDKWKRITSETATLQDIGSTYFTSDYCHVEK